MDYLDFRDVGHLFDFGIIDSCDVRWKFGFPDSLFDGQSHQLTSLDGTCRYYVGSQDRTFPITNWQSLFTQEIKRLGLIDSYVNSDVRGELFCNLKELAIFSTNPEINRDIVSTQISAFPECNKLAIFVHEMTGEDVRDWTSNLVQLKSLCLGNTIDAIFFDAIFSNLPELESLYVQLSNGEFVGGILYAGPGPDEYPSQRINANLEALALNLSESSIAHLGIEAMAPGLTDLSPFIRSAPNLCFLKTISLENLGIPSNVSTLFRSQALPSQCERLRIQNCTFDCQHDFFTLLTSMKRLNTVKLRGLEFRSYIDTKPEPLKIDTKPSYFEISESRINSDFLSFFSHLDFGELEYFCVNSSFFEDGEALRLMKRALSGSSNLKHFDVACTEKQGMELLSALPPQKNRLDFLGIRMTDGIDDGLLAEKFPRGIESIYAGSTQDGIVNNSLINRLQIKRLAFADQRDIKDLLLQGGQIQSNLVQLSLPQCLLSDVQIRDIVSRCPNLQLLANGSQEYFELKQVKVVPNWAGEYQTELLSVINKVM